MWGVGLGGQLEWEEAGGAGNTRGIKIQSNSLHSAPKDDHQGWPTQVTWRNKFMESMSNSYGSFSQLLNAVLSRELTIWFSSSPTQRS